MHFELRYNLELQIRICGKKYDNIWIDYWWKSFRQKNKKEKDKYNYKFEDIEKYAEQ